MSWPPVILRKMVWSCDLVGTDIQQLTAAGYLWVRPIPRPWALTVRNPTIGRYVELTSQWDTGAVELSSREGRKLLRQLAVRSY
jgi:hypothetical protein